MNRLRPFLLLGAALALAASAAPPNILLIVADDQGYGDLSAHGHPLLRTPQLDRLRADSLRLTNFHVAPMCTPTRSQLLTGCDALRNGAMNVSSGRAILRPERPTLPEIFAAAGYRTGLFGKWHLGDNYPYRPQDRGFQTTLWFPSSHLPSAAAWWNNDYFDPVLERDGREEKVPGYCTDIFFGEAMRWMRAQHEQGAPFLCYLPLNAAHAPYFVPERYRAPYAAEPRERASFFGLLANLDENLGRLEEFLAATGLRENTIVIYFSDNGTPLPQPFNAGMRGIKASLYDGGHRVPFFVRWPAGGLRPPADLGELATVQDLLPTLLELCAVPAPPAARFDGVSLAPLWRGHGAPPPERTVVVQFSRLDRPEPQPGDAAVLCGSWRLVNHTELYDVARDPAQARDVAAQFPEVVARLRCAYDAWWAQVAPRRNEFCPIPIGAAAAPEVKLTPGDWMDVFFDKQEHVRRKLANGSWRLEVARAGAYEFELRRWPREAGLALTAAAPAFRAVDGVYGEGLALPVAAAAVRVGEAEATAPVTADAQCVVLRLTLPAGPADLRTAFRDATGRELCGAYFVYVRPAAP